MLPKFYIKLNIDSVSLRFPLTLNIHYLNKTGLGQENHLKGSDLWLDKKKTKTTGNMLLLKYISLFSTWSIYWPTVFARENITNVNTDRITFRFKSTCNFYDTMCHIFNLQANPDCFYHIKQQLYLTLLTTGILWARHRTCWTLSFQIPQLKVF